MKITAEIDIIDGLILKISGTEKEYSKIVKIRNDIIKKAEMSGSFFEFKEENGCLMIPLKR